MSSVVTFLGQRKGGAVASVAVLPLGVRIENTVGSYVRYLFKTVWPDQLAVIYPLPNHWPLWQVVASSVVVVALSALVLGAVRRRPYLLFGWLWYLGTLVPTIGLIPVGWQSIADRYTYVPLIGVFVAITWAVVD